MRRRKLSLWAVLRHLWRHLRALHGVGQAERDLRAYAYMWVGGATVYLCASLALMGVGVFRHHSASPIVVCVEAIVLLGMQCALFCVHLRCLAQTLEETRWTQPLVFEAAWGNPREESLARQRARLARRLSRQLRTPNATPIRRRL